MYTYYIKQKELAEQNALHYSKKHDLFMEVFWKNASKEFERRAKELLIVYF